MNAIHFLGIHVMWVVGAFSLVLLAGGLTVMIFKNPKHFEPGLEQGHATDPAQVMRDNPRDPKR